MKLLTKLEELILITVWRLKDDAYGTAIYRHICRITQTKLSLGGIYFPLDRLTRKGYLSTRPGGSTPDRQGYSKRFYSLSDSGKLALEEIFRVNQEMWLGYDLTGPVKGAENEPG